MNFIKRLAQFISRNLLFFAVIDICLGILVSVKHPFPHPPGIISALIFLMIYPMMVNVSFESLKNINKTVKPLLAAVVINFLASPIVCFIICQIFGASNLIKFSLMMLAISPSSSMGLGYVGLSGGNVLSASVIVAFSFLLSLVVYPSVLHFFSLNLLHGIPTSSLIKNLFLVLILPMALGVITRELLIEKRGIKFHEVKPIFSFLTLACLNILIFFIFSSKGKLLIEHRDQLLLIAPIAVTFYASLLLIAAVLNRYLFHLNYENRQAVVFTSVSKNVALTIGLLTFCFKEIGSTLALYPAIMAVFQMLFIISYLHFTVKQKQL